MIAGLGLKGNLPDLFTGVFGRHFNGLQEEVGLHQVGTTGSDEESAVFDQLHTPEVDLFITGDRFLYLFAALGERGRIEHDHIVLAAFLSPLLQHVESIHGFEAADMLESVQRGIAIGLRYGIFRDVESEYRLRPIMGGMYLKSASVSKCTQYISAFYNMLDGTAVILLVEEIAGLLPVFNVYMKFQPVFVDDDTGVERGR